MLKRIFIKKIIKLSFFALVLNFSYLVLDGVAEKGDSKQKKTRTSLPYKEDKAVSEDNRAENPAKSNVAKDQSSSQSNVGSPKDGPKSDQKSKLASKEPIYINSDRFELDSKNRIFNYINNVVATQGDLKITTNRMDGLYNETNDLQKVICIKNVVVTKGQNIQATSQRAVYFVDKGVIELTESPELTKDGSTLIADKIKLFVDSDKSEAEGNVRVKINKQ